MLAQTSTANRSKLIMAANRSTIPLLSFFLATHVLLFLQYLCVWIFCQIHNTLCRMSGPICQHGRRRYRCKGCRGAGISEHGRQRSKCESCVPTRSVVRTRRTKEELGQHLRVYEEGGCVEPLSPKSSSGIAHQETRPDRGEEKRFSVSLS